MSDGGPKAPSGGNLEANRQDRHTRLKAKRYRHQPIRRVPIPTAQGKTRPSGRAAFEGTVVQDVVREVVEAMDEQDVLDCSYGCRPGRKAHDAGRTRDRGGQKGEGGWILEAAIVSFFDRLDRTTRKERLAMRVADGSLLRLIGQCVHVGGLDGEPVVEPGVGTAQGSVRSPLLGNVYLHHGLALWGATEVKPRIQGKAPLIRYGDDCMSGFAREDDARRVMAVLAKRLERCGLPRHLDKTRLLPFRRPPKSPQSGKGPTTLDVVGFTFYLTRSRKGNWWMTGKPRRASLRRAKTAIDDWCRRHRHLSRKAQHAALHRRFRGHFHDFGVSGNANSMRRLVEVTKRSWYTWLCRRSQRRCLPWEGCTEMLRWGPLPRPRSTVRIWDGSPRATSTEEPDGGNLLVRIW